MSTFSDELYVCLDNKDILEIEEEKILLLKRIKSLDEEINEIRKNCDHLYLKIGFSTYEDVYRCKHCGQVEWK